MNIATVTSSMGTKHRPTTLQQGQELKGAVQCGISSPGTLRIKHLVSIYVDCLVVDCESGRYERVEGKGGQRRMGGGNKRRTTEGRA
jgi:hypothetical protein